MDPKDARLSAEGIQVEQIKKIPRGGRLAWLVFLGGEVSFNLLWD